MSREAMQIALEALEKVTKHFTRTPSTLMDSEARVEAHNAITALRQALETEKQWVGLTDEDIHDAFNFTEMVKQLSWDREPEQWCKNFAAYIEAKLKEKNG